MLKKKDRRDELHAKGFGTYLYGGVHSNVFPQPSLSQQPARRVWRQGLSPITLPLWECGSPCTNGAGEGGLRMGEGSGGLLFARLWWPEGTALRDHSVPGSWCTSCMLSHCRVSHRAQTE